MLNKRYNFEEITEYIKIRNICFFKSQFFFIKYFNRNILNLIVENECFFFFIILLLYNYV